MRWILASRAALSFTSVNEYRRVIARKLTGDVQTGRCSVLFSLTERTSGEVRFFTGTRESIAGAFHLWEERADQEKPRKCYHCGVFNLSRPKTPSQWLAHIVVGIIALFLVWWMVRVYVL